MRLLVTSQVETQLRISNLGTFLAEARTENRARVDARELPELLAKMDDYNGDAITCFAMKLMAYTFVRTSEEFEAPWTEFDLDNARWTISPERMKMNTPHIVPLSHQSLEVLRALKLLPGNGRLAFPGANDKNKPMSNNTILYALYRLGYRDRMTGHGFRGLASTILNENGFEEARRIAACSHEAQQGGRGPQSRDLPFGADVGRATPARSQVCESHSCVPHVILLRI